jgi:hypothetical protein
VFVILYKAVHVQSVSEHVISLTLYLLEMAVCFTEPAENSESQVGDLISITMTIQFSSYAFIALIGLEFVCV